MNAIFIDNHYLDKSFTFVIICPSTKHSFKDTIVVWYVFVAMLLLWGGFMIPCWVCHLQLREREMFYLTTHSTHFIYGYMASDILWLRTILIVRKETCCHNIGYSYWLTARVLLYAPSHRQDNTYHSLCYTSRGALAGTRNSSMGPPHEGSIRRPTAPWANTLPLSYVPLPCNWCNNLIDKNFSISLMNQFSHYDWIYSG